MFYFTICFPGKTTHSTGVQEFFVTVHRDNFIDQDTVQHCHQEVSMRDTFEHTCISLQIRLMTDSPFSPAATVLHTASLFCSRRINIVTYS